MSIHIPGWEKFQHADVTKRGRATAWIRVYTELMSRQGFLELTFHQRGVLVSLWIEYARSRRQLSDNTLTLTRQLGQRVLTRDLKALNQAGFIEIRQDTVTTPSRLEERREEKDAVDETLAVDAAPPTTTSSGFDPDELSRWEEPDNVVELRPKPGLEVNGRPVSQRELLKRFVESRPP